MHDELGDRAEPATLRTVAADRRVALADAVRVPIPRGPVATSQTATGSSRSAGVELAGDRPPPHGAVLRTDLRGRLAGSDRPSRGGRDLTAKRAGASSRSTAETSTASPRRSGTSGTPSSSRGCRRFRLRRRLATRRPLPRGGRSSPRNGHGERGPGARTARRRRRTTPGHLRDRPGRHGTRARRPRIHGRGRTLPRVSAESLPGSDPRREDLLEESTTCCSSPTTTPASTSSSRGNPGDDVLAADGSWKHPSTARFAIRLMIQRLPKERDTDDDRSARRDDVDEIRDPSDAAAAATTATRCDIMPRNVPNDRDRRRPHLPTRDSRTRTGCSG